MARMPGVMFHLGPVFLVGLVVAPGASASSIAVERTIVPTDGRIPGSSISRVVFAAVPGERNDVAVRVDPGAVLVTDAGAAIRSGEGCEVLATGQARCAVTDVDEVSIELGDGDDAGVVEVTWFCVCVRVDGGPGNDAIRGGGVNALHLSGGDGTDDVRAVGPLGALLDGGPGSDRLEGGPGLDTVSYEEARTPVRVDLRAGTGGPVDELDRISGIENVVGSPLADILVGDAGPNRIAGGRGGAGPGDRIHGLEGDDDLTGGRGDDVIEGGPGDDRISRGVGRDVAGGGAGRDTIRIDGSGARASGGPGDDDIATFFDDARGRAPRIACDAGDDTAGTYGRAVVGSSCERAGVGRFDITTPRLRSDRRLTLTLLRRPFGVLNRCGHLLVTTPSGRTLADRIVTRFPTTVTARRIGGRLPSRVVVRIDVLGDACRREPQRRADTAVTFNLSRPPA